MDRWSLRLPSVGRQAEKRPRLPKFPRTLHLGIVIDEAGRAAAREWRRRLQEKQG